MINSVRTFQWFLMLSINKNKKKKCAPVSKSCSSARWKHPFIESGAIRALSKLKNTTGKNVISESFRRCCCFPNNMWAENFKNGVLQQGSAIGSSLVSGSEEYLPVHHPCQEWSEHRRCPGQGVIILPYLMTKRY